MRRDASRAAILLGGQILPQGELFGLRIGVKCGDNMAKNGIIALIGDYF